MADDTDALAASWRGYPIAGRVDAAPRVPDGLRVYAIGDVHGRLDLLDELLARIERDRATRPGPRVVEIWLGDLVDRGPSSAEVMSRIAARDAVLIRGNHEQYLIDCLENGDAGSMWLDYGGREALASWGIAVPAEPSADDRLALGARFARAITAEQRALLARARPFHQVGDFLFVHAGIRPGVPLDRQTRSDLTTIRRDFLESEADHGMVVVHGHSPSRGIVARANRIGIDTGAYMHGVLTCLVVEGATIRFLQAADARNRG